jgi:multiple sugar transport system permease protein
MAPAIVLLSIFVLVPIGYALYLSFTNTRLTGVEAAHPQWIGLDNFRTLFASPDFPNSLVLTLVFVVFSALIGQNLLGLAIALCLQRRGRVMRVAVGVTVLAAYVFPEIVPGFMWTSFLSSDGLLNAILSSVGLPEQQLLIDHPMVAVILADIWRATAFSMLVYAAALSDIPEDLYDAAKVDGASYTRTLWHITLPMLRRTAFTTIMLITLPTLSVFTMVFVLTGGGPGNESETLPVFMYRYAFRQHELGYGTAISVILLAIGAVLALLYVAALRPGREDR